MTTREQTFEGEVQEWLDLTKKMVDKVVMEGAVSPPPYGQSGPPYETVPRFTSGFITRHMLRVCNDNPLYTDPEYGKRTRYGCQIAPGNVLSATRGPQMHGASKQGGYPLLTFFSGVAWEFFDVVRVGAKIRATQVLREIVEKTSNAQGRMFFLISETPYWDFHGDMLGVCRCTEIIVPRDRRKASNYAAGTMYERKESSYKAEEVEELIKGIEASAASRRGAEPRYWEDVEVGEKLTPFIYRPHTLYDMQGSRLIGTGGRVFEAYYARRTRDTGTYPLRTHPVTRWPYSGNAEHQDPILAPYRGQATSFDNGPDRCQVAPQLVLNWMGDDGFLHRYYQAHRRTVYYGDALVYTGEVVRKFKRVHKGEKGSGAAPGSAEYCAVGIRIESTSPGGVPVEGSATVYLPSRESGPVQLPIPHLAQPTHVAYDTYRRDWY